MSVLGADNLSWIPWAVVAASLTGSVHCVGMCGGLALSASRDRRSIALYHGGRWLGYSVWGLVAGALGERVLGSAAWSGLAWIGTLVLGALLLLMGIQVWRGRTPHSRWLPLSWTTRYFRWAGGDAFGLGLGTALLPCGWLQSFVVAAAATRSPGAGALLMSAFWLGTLPALTFGPALLARCLARWKGWGPRISGSILILAGVLSLANRVTTIPVLHGGDAAADAAATADQGAERGHCSAHR